MSAPGLFVLKNSVLKIDAILFAIYALLHTLGTRA